MRAHRALLLNYVQARKQSSSGVIEGLNNKAKVTMRKAYGFRTFRSTELALYQYLANYPNQRSPKVFADEPRKRMRTSPVFTQSPKEAGQHQVQGKSRFQNREHQLPAVASVHFSCSAMGLFASPATLPRIIRAGWLNAAGSEQAEGMQMRPLLAQNASTALWFARSHRGMSGPRIS